MTINNDLETVAAFVDGERVDAVELKRALSTDEGRSYLVELVAMREVVRVDTDVSVAPSRPVPSRHASRVWWLVSAAAVVLAIAGGFALGVRRAPQVETATVQSAPAPTPTKILKLETGVNWKERQSAEGGE